MLTDVLTCINGFVNTYYYLKICINNGSTGINRDTHVLTIVLTCINECLTCINGCFNMNQRVLTSTNDVLTMYQRALTCINEL